MKEYYLIDTSNFLFVTIFGSFNEWKDSSFIEDQQLSPTFDPTVDEEFNYIFNKRFRSVMTKVLLKVNPFHNKSHIIFAMDCPRSEIWRRGIYPGYKLQRDTADHSKDEFDFGSVLKYAYEVLLPSYCDEFGSHIVKCAYAEADDIIAILKKRLTNNGKNNVVIVSSDRDMVQLYDENTTIITPQCIFRTPEEEMKKLMNVDKLDNDITSKEFLFIKCLMGDPADNISSIKKGIGIKTAYKLFNDREKLKKVLSEGDAMDILKRNRQLISMAEIPDEVENLIMENVKESLS